jgi:hypothetical protein
MNDRNGRRPGRRAWLAAALLIVVVVVVALLVRRQRGPRGPRVLNQPTAARQVRPLVPGPDSIVDPLPLEREKHEK